MAKKTKDSNLSIEERLEQALIPNRDELYKLPENWCWIKIGSINNYVGHSINPANTPSDKFELYSVPSSDDNYPEMVFGTEIGSTKQSVEKDDVLLCKINPRINRVWKVSQHTENTLIASSEWIIIRNKNIVSDYLMWCLRSPYFREFMLSNVSGVGGSLMRAQPKYVQNYPIPLPPLGEQKRIVATLEALFSKLEEAKEKAQEVVDGFETRKAAILHKAFSGELCNIDSSCDLDELLSDIFSYRENLIKNKIIQRAKLKAMEDKDAISSFPSSWKQLKLGEISFVTKLAGFEYTKYIKFEESGDIPVVRAQNVRKGYLDTTNLLYIDRQTSENLSRSALDKPSILITFIGAGIGDVCVFDKPQRFHLAPNVAKVEPYCDENGAINIKFLLYYLLSPSGQKEIFKSMKAVAQPSLSMETIRDIVVPFTTKEEQDEIVRIVDNLISKEQQAKEAAEAVIDQIDTMKKAILSRAFCGDLGTNDPDEESAVELLKKIIEQE